MGERRRRTRRRCGKYLQSMQIRHNHIVGCRLHAYSSRIIELAILGSKRAECRQELSSLTGKKIQSMVPMVSDDNGFVFGIKGHSNRSIELYLTLAFFSISKNERWLCGELIFHNNARWWKRFGLFFSWRLTVSFLHFHCCCRCGGGGRTNKMNE